MQTKHNSLPMQHPDREALRFGSLFSGIGGMDLGLERAGMECAWQVEIDEYCRRVLTKHWPNVPKFRDVRECNLPEVELICGGPPCQKTSVAAASSGNRTGETLWPEMFRIVSRLQPTWAIVEQPPGNKAWETTVQGDLEKAGYKVSRLQVSAASVGAFHLRRRVFFVANSDGKRLEVPREDESSKTDSEPWRAPAGNPWLSALPGVLRVADGFSGGLHRRRRIHALGNAVVPQCAEFIGRMILRSVEAGLPSHHVEKFMKPTSIAEIAEPYLSKERGEK